MSSALQKDTKATDAGSSNASLPSQQTVVVETTPTEKNVTAKRETNSDVSMSKSLSVGIVRGAVGTHFDFKQAYVLGRRSTFVLISRIGLRI